MPTGMVARMIIHASFWSADRSCHRLVPGAGRANPAREVKNPEIMRSQSRQK